MDKAEAEKLNDKIQVIYEKPLFEMSTEEMDKAVIELIIRTFNEFAQQVSRGVAINFMWDMAHIENKIIPDKSVKDYGKLFDKWQSNQEESNG